MARYVVRQIPVREGEGFDLLPGERVITAEWDPPIFHVIVLLDEEAPVRPVINVYNKRQDDGGIGDG